MHARRLTLIALAAFALLPVASCNKPEQLFVRDVVVKLSPVDSNPSALYFTIEGGEKDVDLRIISSNSVLRTEIHESAIDPKTGMMSMTKLDSVRIPAGGRVEFKQGGKHAMVWGVNKIARSLGKLQVNFAFSDGNVLIAEGEVRNMDGSLSAGYTPSAPPAEAKTTTAKAADAADHKGH